MVRRVARCSQATAALAEQEDRMSVAHPTTGLPDGGRQESGKPRLSIVITCYNHGRFLDQAIASAMAQTRTQVEVIVVDDGSTDDTRAIAQRWAGVHYVYQQNRGLSAARNRGLRESS